MKPQKNNTCFKCRTRLRVGEEWQVAACVREHKDDPIECCVNGTPSNCKQCIQECVDAAIMAPSYEAIAPCIRNNKCLG